jgi:hypothetical protein
MAITARLTLTKPPDRVVSGAPLETSQSTFNTPSSPFHQMWAGENRAPPTNPVVTASFLIRRARTLLVIVDSARRRPARSISKLAVRYSVTRLSDSYVTVWETTRCHSTQLPLPWKSITRLRPRSNECSNPVASSDRRAGSSIYRPLRDSRLTRQWSSTISRSDNRYEIKSCYPTDNIVSYAHIGMMTML